MIGSPRAISSGLLSLAFVLACQGETTAPTTAPASLPAAVPASLDEIAALVTDNVLATLAINPTSQIVFMGDIFTFTARPKNAAGQVLTRTARWTVIDPNVAQALDSLKATMTFKTLRVASTSVKATVDGMERLAKVTVRAVTGAKVVLTPAVATAVGGGTVRFTATGLTQTNETAAVNVTWKTTTGRISTGGVLTAGTTPGTHRVIATSRFGAADTSVVTITPAPTTALTTVVLVPATASVMAGGTAQFAAYGRTSAGDSVPMTVTYTSTGGTIAGAGLYTAGQTGGTYRVVAANAAGAADTSEVVISTIAGERVTILPQIAASRAGATTRFAAAAWNSLGKTVPATMSYAATCGTVSGAGVFTAPPNGSRSCFVTASANGKVATAEVVILPNLPEQGIPYGIYDMWTSPSTFRPEAPAYTASIEHVPAGDLVRHITAARSAGVRLVLAMTGGSHDRYKTNGVFDLAKWQAAMNAYNTLAIRNAVADALADGTIVGNSVMDEPQQADPATGVNPKSWGPKGTLTKERLDGLCSYVKGIFPGMPVGVGHDHNAFEPLGSYRVCDFIIAQYAYRKTKGNIVSYRDAALALGARDGHRILFSLNLLDGGEQLRTATQSCPIPRTGGDGTHGPNCRVSPAQLRDWGKALGEAGCAMLGWRYDASFMAKAENQEAIADVAITLSRLPRRPCTGNRGPNTPPTAAFASSCSDLACSFTDGSTDPGGRVIAWSWDFGDGNTSTARHPTHTYRQGGGYEVRLRVTDDRSATASVTRTVTVTAPPPVNTPPTAAFASSCDGLSCGFTDQSTDADGTLKTWSWNLGDGSSSAVRHPDHTYAEAGSYQVTLTVTDNDDATGTVTRTVTVTAPPPPNTPPTAAFAPSCDGLSCSFTDGSTDEGVGTVDAWLWDFGDGNTSAVRHPDHTYAEAGSYQVTLTVTDNDDATGTVTRTVTVTAPPPPNTPPTAAFAPSCDGLSCTFTDGSTDAEGTLKAWSWDFGDGSTSAERSPSHTYDLEGPYEVTLTVIDQDDAIATVTQTVTVTAPAGAPIGQP